MVTEVPVASIHVRFVGEKVVPESVVIFPSVACKFVAKKFVDVVFVPVADVQVMFVGEKVVPEIVVAESVVNCPFVEKRFVVVTDVPVPFANVTFWRFVLPSTVNVDVTVEEDPINPPYN